ncbi:uncharacterized protein LOC144327188 isoform X2 [Podarcis muralis]
MSIALLWSCVTVGGGETLVYSEFQSRSCVISSEELESENISVSRVWERRKPGGFRQWQTTFCRRPFTSCRETGTVSYLKKWKVRIDGDLLMWLIVPLSPPLPPPNPVA